MGRGADSPELARRAARRGGERRRAHLDPRRRALSGCAGRAPVRDRPRRRPAHLPLGERRRRSRLRHHPHHPRRRPPCQRGSARRRVPVARRGAARLHPPRDRARRRRQALEARGRRVGRRSARRRVSAGGRRQHARPRGELRPRRGARHGRARGPVRHRPDRARRRTPRPGPPAIALGASPGPAGERRAGRRGAAVLPARDAGRRRRGDGGGSARRSHAGRGRRPGRVRPRCSRRAIDAAGAGGAPPWAPRAPRRGAGPRARRRAPPARNPAQACPARADREDDRARAWAILAALPRDEAVRRAA